MGKICVLGLLVLTGCGVWSEHPLSDERTSEIDERLIGWWEGVKEEPDDDPPPRLLVGRRGGRENTMEAGYLELDEDGVLQVRRILLYATAIGRERYLSTSDEKEKAYALVHYALKGPDEIRLHFLDDAYVKKVIEDETLPGFVEEGESETIMITLPTKQLRTWIGKHHAKCFALGEPSVFRRVKGKSSSSRSAGDGADEKHDAEDQKQK